MVLSGGGRGLSWHASGLSAGIPDEVGDVVGGLPAFALGTPPAVRLLEGVVETGGSDTVASAGGDASAVEGRDAGGFPGADGREGAKERRGSAGAVSRRGMAGGVGQGGG